MSFRDEFIEGLSDPDMLELLYPELLTWHSEALGREPREITSRCGVRSLQGLPAADIAAFLSTPGFSEGRGSIIVHPDDERPPRNATCQHPRFGTLRILEWGAEPYLTGGGLRRGAVTWT